MPAGATDETGAGGKEDVPTEAEVVSIKSSEVMPTEAEVVSIKSSEVMPTEAEVISIKSSEVMPTPVGSAPVGSTPVASAAHRHRVASAPPHAVASEPATERHRAGRYGRCANRQDCSERKNLAPHRISPACKSPPKVNVLTSPVNDC